MKTKVLYLSWMGHMGGAEVALERLIQEFDQDRYEIHVWQFKEGPLKEKLEALGVQVTVKPVSRFLEVLLKPWLLCQSKSYVKNNDIQVVHAVGTLSYVLGWLPAKLTKIPILWWLVDEPKGQDPFEKLAAKLKPEMIVCNSHFTQQAYRNRYPKPVKSCVVYPSVDLDQQATGTEVIEAREKITRDHYTKIVLHVGRLQDWKGQDILIRAIPEIIKVRQNFRFLFLGDALPGMESNYKEELKALAEELGVSDYCHFLGFQKDPAIFYQMADLVVHSSKSPEPFGLVVAEAMVHERALVASNEGGPAEIVEHGEEGWLIAPNDPTALMEAVLRLIDDDDLREKLGTQARKKVESLFGEKAIAKQMSDLYQLVIKP